MYKSCLFVVIGNHTFAAVKSAEKYDHLKAALEPVLAELNELLRTKEIIIHGRPVSLEIVFGSDLKVGII